MEALKFNFENKKAQPFRFTIICKKTGKHRRQNDPPSLRSLQTYEPTEDKKIFILTQTFEVVEDLRYKARLRLFNYLQKKQNKNH